MKVITSASELIKPLEGREKALKVLIESTGEEMYIDGFVIQNKTAFLIAHPTFTLYGTNIVLQCWIKRQQITQLPIYVCIPEDITFNPMREPEMFKAEPLFPIKSIQFSDNSYLLTV